MKSKLFFHFFHFFISNRISFQIQKRALLPNEKNTFDEKSLFIPTLELWKPNYFTIFGVHIEKPACFWSLVWIFFNKK